MAHHAQPTQCEIMRKYSRILSTRRTLTDLPVSRAIGLRKIKMPEERGLHPATSGLASGTGKEGSKDGTTQRSEDRDQLTHYLESDSEKWAR